MLSELQASQSVILLCSYFVWWEYILVLAALSWAGRLKINGVMQNNYAIKRHSLSGLRSLWGIWASIQDPGLIKSKSPKNFEISNNDTEMRYPQ